MQEHIYITHPEYEETVCIHRSCLKRYKREGWELVKKPEVKTVKKKASTKKDAE